MTFFTKLQAMQAAAILQNPLNMPRTVTPQDVMGQGQGAAPPSARDNEGMSEGVMKAERTAKESSDA